MAEVLRLSRARKTSAGSTVQSPPLELHSNTSIRAPATFARRLLVAPAPAVVIREAAHLIVSLWGRRLS